MGGGEEEPRRKVFDVLLHTCSTYDRLSYILGQIVLATFEYT